MIGRVNPRVNPRDHYKITVAIKFCKSKFTDFRSDERRKVVILVMLLENILLHLIIMIIGPGNCTMCHLNTKSLTRNILCHIQVPDDIDEELYIRHLALFVSKTLF